MAKQDHRDAAPPDPKVDPNRTGQIAASNDNLPLDQRRRGVSRLTSTEISYYQKLDTASVTKSSDRQTISMLLDILVKITELRCAVREINKRVGEVESAEVGVRRHLRLVPPVE